MILGRFSVALFCNCLLCVVYDMLYNSSLPILIFLQGVSWYYLHIEAVIYQTFSVSSVTISHVASHSLISRRNKILSDADDLSETKESPVDLPLSFPQPILSLSNIFLTTVKFSSVIDVRGQPVLSASSRMKFFL